MGFVLTGKINLVQKYHRHDLVFSKPFVLEELFRDWLISWVQLHDVADRAPVCPIGETLSVER